jgi:hypothetical protein
MELRTLFVFTDGHTLGERGPLRQAPQYDLQTQDSLELKRSLFEAWAFNFLAIGFDGGTSIGSQRHKRDRGQQDGLPKILRHKVETMPMNNFPIAPKSEHEQMKAVTCPRISFGATR